MPLGSKIYLLAVTEDVPNRDPVAGNGSSMIPYEVLRRLDDGFVVRLITFGGTVPIPEPIARRAISCEVLPLARGSAARFLIGGEARAATARLTSSHLRHIVGAARRADVVLLHGPHVSGLAARLSTPTLVQIVDPWSHRMKVEAQLAAGPKRLHRLWQARRSSAAERRIPPAATLATVGKDDAARWAQGLGRPVLAIPNGVDGGVAVARRASAAPTIGFLGSLDYGPNVDSARLLVETIAPMVWRAEPRARLLLVGRNPTPEVRALVGERVELRANVPSVGEVLAEVDAAAFPDRVGVGSRNSVREVLAAGVPVVASPTAAREIAASPLLRVARDEEEIASELLAVLRDPPAAPADGGQLRSWDECAADYAAALSELVARP